MKSTWTAWGAITGDIVQALYYLFTFPHVVRLLARKPTAANRAEIHQQTECTRAELRSFPQTM